MPCFSECGLLTPEVPPGAGVFIVQYGSIELLSWEVCVYFISTKSLYRLISV